LRKGEKLSEKIEMQLAAIKKMPRQIRALLKPQLSPILPTSDLFNGQVSVGKTAKISS